MVDDDDDDCDEDDYDDCDDDDDSDEKLIASFPVFTTFMTTGKGCLGSRENK